MIKMLLLTKHNCKWHSLMDFCNITTKATIKRKENITKKNCLTLALCRFLSLSLSLSLQYLRLPVFVLNSLWVLLNILLLRFYTSSSTLNYDCLLHTYFSTCTPHTYIQICMHVHGYVKQLLFELISICMSVVCLCTHQTLSKFTDKSPIYLQV